ncbi:hypothetical protein LIER_38982 [Lithospermum erythrorhizon]|uniref:Uncharacterized protein n=1 Tax=Lithospermum erythrorhizon TaxID=34254 RepID=A0AAV3QAJ3_LITER
MFTTLPFLVDPFAGLFANIFFCLSSDVMSQSSENQADNFVLCPRGEADQDEDSISGGMPLIQIGGPLNQITLQQPEPENPTPPRVTVEGAIEEAARTENPYQGIMASLPTFLKNSTPPYLTDD